MESDDQLIARMDWELLDQLMGGELRPGAAKVLIVTNPIQSHNRFWEEYTQQPPEERDGR